MLTMEVREVVLNIYCISIPNSENGGGIGVQKFENVADVIYVWSLARRTSFFLSLSNEGSLTVVRGERRLAPLETRPWRRGREIHTA